MSHSTGAPQGGVRVDVIRTGGVRLSADSLSTTTDRNGHWAISTAAEEAGTAIVTIGIHSPDFGTYRVADQSFTTTEVHGDGSIVQPWVVDPHFPYAAELYYRGTADVRVAQASIEFIRRGGLQFYLSNAVTPDVYGAKTDASGRVVLFDVNAHSTALGSVTGDLVVHLPSPFRADTLRGVTLSSTYRLQTPVQILRYGVGPSLLYTGELHERSSDKPAAGVKVTFRRVSGVATEPQTFTATTDAGGRFLFPLRALGEGSVTGELEFVPRLGSPAVVKNVVLRPHRQDNSEFFGVWAVGPALPWVALVQIGGRGIEGIEAEFHRTGGIPVVPSDYVMRSNVNGYIALNPQPQAVGVVEADVIVHAPPPFADMRAHVSLPTVENDTVGGVFRQFNLDTRTTSPGQATVRIGRP